MTEGQLAFDWGAIARFTGQPHITEFRLNGEALVEK